MRINIFRSETSGSYPQEYQGWRWDFAPIAYAASVRDGLLMGSIYSSGDEPFAVVDAPAGSRVAESRGGYLALYLPGRTTGLEAEEAYDLAKYGSMGLSIPQKSATTH